MYVSKFSGTKVWFKVSLISRLNIILNIDILYTSRLYLRSYINISNTILS